MTHYETLGVEKAADAATITAAFRRLAQRFHPDRETGDAAAYDRVVKAYEILRDPEKRADYDANGEAPELSTAETHLLGMMAQVFDTAAECDYRLLNLRSLLSASLRQQRKAAHSRLDSLKGSEARLKRVLKQPASFKGTMSFVIPALTTAAARIEPAREQVEQLLALLKDVEALLQDCPETLDLRAPEMDPEIAGYLASRVSRF